MSTSLKQDILNAVAESKCNTCALLQACNSYDEHHCKENGFSRYEPTLKQKKELNSIIKKLKRRLKRAEHRYYKLKVREKHLSEHGQWELGYWQGQITTLEDCIDDLEEDEWNRLEWFAQNVVQHLNLRITGIGYGVVRSIGLVNDYLNVKYVTKRVIWRG